MDFRLRVFTEVARHLSFTKAARELSISQPAITKHIQELESMYGIELFERSAGKISLTGCGKIFLDHTNRILGGYKALAEDMELLSNQIDGILRLGIDKRVQREISPVLADFTDKFPQLTIELLIGNALQIECALDGEKIDMAIVGKDIIALSFVSKQDDSDKKSKIFEIFAKRQLFKNQRTIDCTP